MTRNLFIVGVSQVKMASPMQKAFRALECNNCHSVITVQRGYRQRYSQEPPNTNKKCRCHQMFQETGCLCKGKSSGRSRVSAQNLEKICLTYE
ncbi:DUF4817 domain-containing protein [Trichonephila clavipes]|nr:DUF4817 domain-containing protein [Trichonephila clavipes]